MINKTLRDRRVIIMGALLVAVMAAGVMEAAGPYYFYPITPCRVVDTRSLTPPVITMNGVTPRTFTIKGNCGIPTDALAVAVNATINQPVITGGGWLALYPSGTTFPGISTINFASTDVSLANGAIVPLGAGADDLSVMTKKIVPGTVHLIIDVTGYYK